MARRRLQQNDQQRAKYSFFAWCLQFEIQLRKTGGHPTEITQIGKFNHDRMNERDQNKTGKAPKHRNSALTAGNDANVERSKGGVRSNRHSSK